MVIPLLLMLLQQPILENERVSVQLVTDPPHSTTIIHRHALDRVMIYVDDSQMRSENANGLVETQAWKAGQAAWIPAGGEYTRANGSDRVLRVMEVELKPSVPSGKALVLSPLDPVGVDPKHYRVEFENLKVRVIHCKYNPYESGAVHTHLNDRIVVYLIGDEEEVTTQDGKVHLLKPPADSVWWSGYAKHRDVADKSPIEMIVVELR